MFAPCAVAVRLAVDGPSESAAIRNGVVRSRCSVSASCSRNRGTPSFAAAGIASGAKRIATFSRQRAINSLRLEVRNSWSIATRYAIAAGITVRYRTEILAV